MKAFPNSNDTAINVRLGRDEDPDGMDLRDYFAAKAMQGMINASVSAYYNGTIQNYDHKKEAKESYEIADAMMEARNEQ